MSKKFTLIHLHEMNNLILVIGGNVIHSYGRLVHDEYVITRGNQLLPPGNGTGPGRLDCIRTAAENARFIFKGGKGGRPPNNLVNQGGGQKASLSFNGSYLPMNTFDVEYTCQDDTYICIYLSPGNNYY